MYASFILIVPALNVKSLSEYEAYTLDQKMVAHFTFPRLGIAVPLWPGDVLFFNLNKSHCVSSCCDNTDEIYCLSLYLKSDNLGLNNNSKKLLPMEKYLFGRANFD